MNPTHYESISVPWAIIIIIIIIIIMHKYKKNFAWFEFRIMLHECSSICKKRKTWTALKRLLIFLLCLMKKLFFYPNFFLTLSRRRPLSYRNQSINLLCKSMDWFQYDNGPRLERVKNWKGKISFCRLIDCIFYAVLPVDQ